MQQRHQLMDQTFHTNSKQTRSAQEKQTSRLKDQQMFHLDGLDVSPQCICPLYIDKFQPNLITPDFTYLAVCPPRSIYYQGTTYSYINSLLQGSTMQYLYYNQPLSSQQSTDFIVMRDWPNGGKRKSEMPNKSKQNADPRRKDNKKTTS